MFKKINPDYSWIIFDSNPKMKQNVDDVILPLNDEDIRTIEKMISYVDSSYDDTYKQYNLRPGIGIAAIQLGYPKKIIYIHFDEKNIEHKYLLANPKIISHSKNKSYLSGGEGCLSVDKNYSGYSIRDERVIVEAIDLFTNKLITIDAKGMLSICLQHEIDHTNNKFFYDRINHNEPYFYEKEWKKI